MSAEINNEELQAWLEKVAGSELSQNLTEELKNFLERLLQNMSSTKINLVTFIVKAYIVLRESNPRFPLVPMVTALLLSTVPGHHIGPLCIWTNQKFRHKFFVFECMEIAQNYAGVSLPLSLLPSNVRQSAYSPSDFI